MSLSQTLRIYELLDDASVTGSDVVKLFTPHQGLGVTAKTETVIETRRADFLDILVPGTSGKAAGDGSAPTLGLIGRNGSIGGRPTLVGMVSDADGATTAIAAALRLSEMKRKGDTLPGDVRITTHLCTEGEVVAHDPVDFIVMPCSSVTMNAHEVTGDMDPILSIDTSKGNRILNRRGFAITPTAKEGYILRTSADLLRIMEAVTGRDPAVMPITLQDISDYDNGLYHVNSIMQPHMATAAPVVGVPICAQVSVAGSATGASHEIDIAEAVRFCVEVAKAYGAGKCRFFDPVEFEYMFKAYGSLAVFQSKPAPLRRA
jgi:hypothetical protein